MALITFSPSTIIKSADVNANFSGLANGTLITAIGGATISAGGAFIKGVVALGNGNITSSILSLGATTTITLPVASTVFAVAQMQQTDPSAQTSYHVMKINSDSSPQYQHHSPDASVFGFTYAYGSSQSAGSVTINPQAGNSTGTSTFANLTLIYWTMPN